MSSQNFKLGKVSALCAANFAVGMTLYADLAVADYHLPYATPTTINEWGVCYVVTNTVGPTAFVPTTSASEWTNIEYNHGTLAFSGCGIGQGDAGCGGCGDGGGGPSG